MDLISALEQDFAHWDSLYKNGGQDPFWADGANLNLVRAHIIGRKREIEEECPLLAGMGICTREVPPVVPDDYMARPDEIRANAKKAQEQFAADPNLAWLRDHRNELNPRQRSQTCIDNVIGYSAALADAIEHDDLVAMRRFEYPDRYLQSFANAVQRVLALGSSETPCEDADDEDEDFDMEVEM